MSDKLQLQKDFFAVNHEEDLGLVIKNKKEIGKVVDFLIMKGLLDGTNFQDYELLNSERSSESNTKRHQSNQMC